MQPAKDAAAGRREVDRLVRAFHRDADHYRSPSFNETATRVQFIDPLWAALGWDVTDEHRRLGPDREVLVEDPLRITPTVAGPDAWDEYLTDEEREARSAITKFPDYVFRLGTERQFLCEAKKPAVPLRSKAPSFQAKSYGWSMKVPLAVLTDFDEFRVFDTRYEPRFDRPEANVASGLDFDDATYLDHWDDLWELLSRDAVHGGSLDRYRTTVSARGSTPVDRAFLATLAAWRETLAHDLLANNPGLTRWELAEATQRILDRVVFIRSMEDRGVVGTVVLAPFARRTDAYRSCTAKFRELDSVYNGQLFAEHFSERLAVSDAVFQRLVEQLYPPASPYRFDAVTVDLLGSIYERFLGQEITVDEGRVSIEAKPEVRHAGGVYYTPRWVVDRLVEDTLGPLVEDKTPRTVANLRVIDIACGSGAFLLGAFDYLVRWHERYYDAHPTKDRDRHFVNDAGERRLTADAKGAIAAANLYGVDIDAQAVEVTQMSLYLAILEGESSGTLNTQTRLFHAPFLPDLTDNIRCGNSLIETEDLSSGLLLADEDLARRVNPFDWTDPARGFEAILSERGGFDAVLGNPPYTRVQVLRRYRPDETDIYQRKYRSARSGSFDIAAPFVERAIQLLRPGGRLGYIVTRQFCEADTGEELRRFLSDGRHVSTIVDFTHGLVFEGANAYTVLLEATKKPSANWNLVRVPPPPSARALREASRPGSPWVARQPAGDLGPTPWDLALPPERALLDRLANDYPNLGEVGGGVVFQAPVTGADYVFKLADLGEDPHNSGLRRVRHRKDGQEASIEADLLRPVWQGSSDLRRFRAATSTELLLLPYRREHGGQYELLTPAELKGYPAASAWLSSYETELRARSGKWADSNWWGYSRRQNLELWDDDKIAVPYMVDELCAVLDRDRHWMVNVSTGGYGIPTAPLADPDLVAALLNSSLLSWVLRHYSRAFAGDWFGARRGNLIRLPIVTDLDRASRDTIVEAAQHCRLAGEGTELEDPASVGAFETALASFDDLVFDAYAVSALEVGLVRASRSGSRPRR